MQRCTKPGETGVGDLNLKTGFQIFFFRLCNKKTFASVNETKRNAKTNQCIYSEAMPCRLE
jgi:hypothetical protein